MNYENHQPLATIGQQSGQHVATHNHQGIQPIYPARVATVATVANTPDFAQIQGYSKSWQHWQQSQDRFPLLIVVFLCGGLVGGAISFLIAVAFVKQPPPIINNPPADIINPDCKIFCGN